MKSHLSSPEVGLFVFQGRVSLYSLGTSSVDQVGLELIDICLLSAEINIATIWPSVLLFNINGLGEGMG